MKKLLAVLAIGVGMLVTANDAHAGCGMGDEYDWYKQEIANVDRAEALLAEGKPQEAAWLIQRTWPRMHEAVPVASSLPHIARGVRVMAIAAVRSNGDVKTGLGWASRTPLERSLNVAWGVARLRMLVKADPNSAVAKTDLKEALEKTSVAVADAKRGPVASR
jgi:hypothetical protein